MTPKQKGSVSPCVYIFLDESGNFDFRESGSRYLVMTCVEMCRPFPGWELLDDYKYRCIENGMDIEYFHCYADRKHVRNTVFNVIAQHLDNMRISCVVIEKTRVSPMVHEPKRLYQWMLDYLLGRVLAGEVNAEVKDVIVITDTIPVNERRKAIVQSIQLAVARNQPPNMKYRILHHQSRTHYGLQIADYCCWAIFRKWESGDCSWYDRISPAVNGEFNAVPKKRPS